MSYTQPPADAIPINFTGIYVLPAASNVHLDFGSTTDGGTTINPPSDNAVMDNFMILLAI